MNQVFQTKCVFFCWPALYRARLTARERAPAVNAAKSMGLNVAGVDLLRAERGPVVIEVNSSPGLEGLESATGLDIATLQIAFIDKQLETVVNRAKLNNTREKD